MAFPDTPLDIRTELLVDGEWLDVSGDVYNRDPVRITYGRPDEAGRPDPKSATFTLSNRDGKYTPRNPRSPLYGKIGRNTPVRISVPGDEGYGIMRRLDGYGWTTPNTPDLAASGKTLDVRAEISMDWSAPGHHGIIGIWDTDDNQRGWIMRAVDGHLRFLHGTLGGSSPTYFYTMPLPPLPERAAVRVVISPDRLVDLYWAESLNGTWNRVGEGPIDAGAPAFFDSSADLTIGPYEKSSPGLGAPFEGLFHRAEIYIDGNLVAAPDFRPTSETDSAPVDSTGRVWTPQGGAHISDRAIRFEGEVSSWPTDWTPNGGDSWVSVQASGLSRRLGQRKKPLVSALTRRVTSFEPVAYWPFEESEGASKAYSPLPGVLPADAVGFQFGGDSPAGSAPLPVFQQGGYLNAQVPFHEEADFWAVSWVMYIPEEPQTMTYLMKVASSGTAVRHHVVYEPAGGAAPGFRLHGFGPKPGESFFDQEEKYDFRVLPSDPWVKNLWGRWVSMRFRVYLPSDTSLDPRAELHYRVIGTDISQAAFAFFSSTPRSQFRAGAPSRIYNDQMGESASGIGFGHLAVYNQSAHYAIFDGADDGYRGELGHARMERIAQEAGVKVFVNCPEGMPAMGPQRPETLLDTLDGIAKVDGGILTESLAGRGLLYRGRSTIYNQDPKLTLSFGQVAPPLLPVDDDQALVNDATVSHTGGASARAVLESGPMSVQDPPDGAGLYDTAEEINAYGDDQLQPYADWMVHLGTWPESRYPVVRLNLRTNPELIPGVLRLQLLDRMVVNDPPDWLPPDPIDLLVQGWTEELSLTTWDLELNCTPYGPWDVGTIADENQTDVYRADTDGSILHLPVDSVTDTFHVTTMEGPLWVTAGLPLNSNPSFETDLSGWSAVGATIERVPTPAGAQFAGSWSMKITPTGAGSNPRAQTSQTPVKGGADYEVSGWLRCSEAHLVSLSVNWYSETGAYLSTSSASFTPTPDVWQYRARVITAPETARFAALVPTIAGTADSSVVLWVDDASLRRHVLDSDPSQFPLPVTIGGENMTVRSIEDSVFDNFARTEVGAWGMSDSGDPWTPAFGALSEFNVNGTAGTIKLDPANYAQTSVRAVELLFEYADCDVVASFATDMLPIAGAEQLVGLYSMAASGSAFFWTNLRFGSAGDVALQVRNVVTTQGDTVGLPFTITPGQKVWLRSWTKGNRVRARAWLDGQREPRGWQIDRTITDATQTSGAVGVMAAATDLTSAPTFSVSDYRMVNPQTFTVVRGDLTTDHPAGSAVNVTHPLRIAW